MLAKIKGLFEAFLFEQYLPKIECQCRKERFGSNYGGWDVAAENITNQSIVYSFGIGEDASFDIELIERFGMIVHAFDPTPKSIDWIRYQNLPNKFVFHEYGLAASDGEVYFNPPENPRHISYTILDRPENRKDAILVKVKRLETIMKELKHEKIDILKMDIEGAEYQVIEDIAVSNIRPTQIMVEFHHRFPNVGVKKTKDAISKLKGMGYCLFSISSSREEFSFIHNSP